MSGVFAIGDLVGGFQLAHSVSAEGIHAIEYILGNNPDIVEQSNNPRCVYTHPEIATFGVFGARFNTARDCYNYAIAYERQSTNGRQYSRFCKYHSG